MGLLDLIFPKSCLNCKKAGKYVCEICLSKVKKAKGICPVCDKASIDGFTHTKCKKKYSVDGLVSVWEYAGIVRKAIIGLKYKYASEIAKELTDYVLKTLKQKEILVPENYILVPIPLHRLRENSRGFNQSSELGKQIAQKMNWKFIPNLLMRKKLNTPQAQLGGEERRKNIKGVFTLNPKFTLGGLNVILFDDVYTTGSTIKEAAKVLKRNGAGSVWGLTIAK